MSSTSTMSSLSAVLFEPSGYERKVINECELIRSKLGFFRDDGQFASKLLISFPDYCGTGDFGFAGTGTKPITHVANCLSRTPIMRFDLRCFDGTKASSRDAMKALARRTNRFPRSMDGKTVHMDRKTIRMNRKVIGMNPAKIDMDQKIIGMDRMTGGVSRLRIVSGPKSIHMNWKSLHLDRKRIHMDEKTIGMTRTTIHITRKTNRAATDIDHAMIHTDRSRDPYGNGDSGGGQRRAAALA
jgi:hypothetical protein